MERCKKICVKEQRAVNRILKKLGKYKLTLPGKKSTYDNCMKTRCNPGCKGTVFEEGPQWFSHTKKNMLQEKIRKSNIKNKQGIYNETMNTVFSRWKREREEMMKESRGKLLNKNSFYRTMKKSPPPPEWLTLKEYRNMLKTIPDPSIYKKQIKKQGALSGCHRYVSIQDIYV
jgi:hypothetical protein